MDVVSKGEDLEPSLKEVSGMFGPRGISGLSLQGMSALILHAK